MKSKKSSTATTVRSVGRLSRTAHARSLLQLQPTQYRCDTISIDEEAHGIGYEQK